MMNLTFREEEAFLRGQAAGIIPADCPLPETMDEIFSLIRYIGPMFSRIVACRTNRKKLIFVTVSVFSESYLAEVIGRLPELLNTVSEVTPLQKEWFGSPLDELANYFALGPAIVSESDIVAWSFRLTADDIRKGFELKYEPETESDAASMEQRVTLSELVIRGSIPMIDRRRWEQLTGKEADELIRSRKEPDKLNMEKVRRPIREYDRLTPKEKARICNVITSKGENAHD